MKFFNNNLFLLNLNRLLNKDIYKEHLNNYLEDFNFYEIKNFYNSNSFFNYIMLDFNNLKKKERVNYIFNEYNDFFKNLFLLDENYNFRNYRLYKLFLNEYNYNRTFNFIKINRNLKIKQILVEFFLIGLNFKSKFFLKLRRFLFDVFEQYCCFIEKFCLKKKRNKSFINFSFYLDLNDYNYLYFFDRFKKFFFKI